MMLLRMAGGILELTAVRKENLKTKAELGDVEERDSRVLSGWVCSIPGAAATNCQTWWMKTTEMHLLSLSFYKWEWRPIAALPASASTCLCGPP